MVLKYRRLKPDKKLLKRLQHYADGATFTIRLYGYSKDDKEYTLTVETRRIGRCEHG